MRDNEEGLVEAAKRGDQLAYARLERRYRTLILSRACGYFIPGGNRDDLVQEGRIGFWKAVRDYSAELGRFSSFAEICVKRQIITAVKTATRKKQSPLNGFTSFDLAVDKEEDARCLLETLTDLKSRSTEEIYLELEESGRIARRLAESLSPFEASVLRLYYNGHSYEVIAHALNRNVKAVDNGIQRLRHKYSAALIEEGARLTH